MYYVVQAISISRIPIAIVLAWLVSTYPMSLTLLGIGIILLSILEISDWLDGHLARKHNVVSEFGATLDPYTDSISRLITYWGLAQAGLALVILPLIMAIRDITVAYCRIQLSRSGQTVAARKSGKIKAVVQAVGGYLLLLSTQIPDFTDMIVVGVSSIVGVLTLLSAIEYIRDALNA